MSRHSAPLLLVIGVLIAWASIRTALLLADETGSRLAAANTPLLAPPRDRPRSLSLASPGPPPWTISERSPATGWLNRPTGAAGDPWSNASRHPQAIIGSSSGVAPPTSVPERGTAEAVSALRPADIVPLDYDQRRSQPVTQASANPARSRGQFLADRWALSAWAYVRPDGERGPRFDLARLGGTQVGVNATRRVDRAGQVNLFARVVTSGAIGDGLEGATGLALRPSPGLPVTLVIERREQLAGTGGRSAFAAYATGGFDGLVLGRGITLDVYGAAGVVGMARRDLFGEGSVVAARRMASIAGVDVDAGVGAWGAAQPGAARLDIGPRLSARLPIGDTRPLLAIDWRQRMAGDVAPASGVALTLAADF